MEWRQHRKSIYGAHTQWVIEQQTINKVKLAFLFSAVSFRGSWHRTRYYCNCMRHISRSFIDMTLKPKKKFINYQQFWVIFGQQSWEELQGWSKISSSKDTHGLLRVTASVASKGISSLTKQYSNKRKFIASCCLQMKTVSSSKRIKMYRTVYIESQNKVAHLFFPIFYA